MNCHCTYCINGYKPVKIPRADLQSLDALIDKHRRAIKPFMGSLPDFEIPIKITSKTHKNGVLTRKNYRSLQAFGREQAMHLWAKEVGIDPVKLRNRIHRGWDVERALTEGVLRPPKTLAKK